jgi:hypothetical protein
MDCRQESTLQTHNTIAAQQSTRVFSLSVSTLIYVETRIPSFFSETRTGLGIEARRQWTREWWAKPKPDQVLVTSVVVFEELERIPDEARREKSLALVRPFQQLNTRWK